LSERMSTCLAQVRAAYRKTRAHHGHRRRRSGTGTRAVDAAGLVSLVVGLTRATSAAGLEPRPMSGVSSAAAGVLERLLSLVPAVTTSTAVAKGRSATTLSTPMRNGSASGARAPVTGHAVAEGARRAKGQEACGPVAVVAAAASAARAGGVRGGFGGADARERGGTLTATACSSTHARSPTADVDMAAG
jgi:hypothetical protein